MQSKLACTNRSLYKPPTSAWLTKVLGTQPNLGGGIDCDECILLCSWNSINTSINTIVMAACSRPFEINNYRDS